MASFNFLLRRLPVPECVYPVFSIRFSLTMNKKVMMATTIAKAWFAALLLLCVFDAEAQYFGRNKPIYQQHDFKVHQTPNFEIYEYLDNPDRLREIAAAAEVWYAMHQAVLRDTIRDKNPLVLYNDHAGFQQTNTILGGGVSVGTGGVTEGFRNRVIFPIAMTNQQTHHVLGHELVHAFQYNMILNGDSTNMRNLGNLPLWMIEGLAEYLSIGRIDPHTALWMRDAVINDDLPRIRDLNNMAKYFPYRWGQAFWAFVTGVYGDDVIRPLFMNTAKYGLDPAIALTLGVRPDSLSAAWQHTLRKHYGQWVSKGKVDKLPGKPLIDDPKAGRMNIGPALSPNGKYVVFLSEKNLFSIDLFLADAKNGNVIRKLASSTQDGHIDQFNFIESAGTWAPDNKRFAFDVYEQGRSVLVVKDALRGKTLEKISIPDVPAFSNPAWSPDGKSILVTGLVNGQTDLYLYDIRSKKTCRLTNDPYSEIHASWSSDGSQIVFATDQMSMERGRTNGVLTMNIAVMDVVTGDTKVLDFFFGADNMTPHFDKSGQIYFLSNCDGFRNLYRYDPARIKVYQLTSFHTGITGITPYAPAFTVSENRDRIVYTHYNKGAYQLYIAKDTDFTPVEVDPSAVDLLPATLPPFNPRQRDSVNANLRLYDTNLRESLYAVIPHQTKYKPKFSLDYIGGSTGVGVATGNTSFGAATGLIGGVDMLFSDILGNNRIFAGAALNGEITDAAGQVTYLNQKKRINWGLNASHIPFRTGRFFPDPNPIPREQTTLSGQIYFGYQDQLLVRRLFQERISAFTFYPLSSTKRFELGGSFEFFHERFDRYLYYVAANGLTLGVDRQRLPKDPSSSFSMSNINAAFVGDNSFFGLTAPLQGWRYRIGYERFLGFFNFNTILLDGRYYQRMRPFTLAVRGLTYGRIGGNADQVFPLFVGQPFFVRGYTNNFVFNSAPGLIEQMAGSKIAVANAELRLPFTGPRQLAVIPSGFLLTDLNFFFDAGLAWYSLDDLRAEQPLGGVRHEPLMSVGASLRINLFGALVVEPYYALPLALSKELRQWQFGLNLIPGW